ncbi:uncharacterized protein N7484_011281 [Penicillium longicatenatum]|uniref:uncharacterized protein n=1 Tax=Penicillium longicatenatum TaxID=1561947 RepID=UPI00254745B7|nr:uncharacterized protein N7484_011281 [Penicillium longicatenatum]KAJ5631181.1 hypothetical protein N7484_011281 [Penicillium longicatenatum]
MQFITVIIATLAAVATATPSPDAFEKRTCVGRGFDSMDKIEDYKNACESNGPSCCDGWQCVGATEWNAGVCIPNY